MFASELKKGTIPIWPNSLMDDHVRPAAKRAGIEKQVSWKMFRTTLATQMNDNGENIKTSQQTLGHASSQLTADVYTQAVPSTVRSAHDRIVDMILLDEDEENRESQESHVGPIGAPERRGDVLSC